MVVAVVMMVMVTMAYGDDDLGIGRGVEGEEDEERGEHEQGSFQTNIHGGAPGVSTCTKG